MDDVIELEDRRRVDVPSQKILLRLNTEEWAFTGDLQDAAELAQNTQVLYRMEEHLIPAGFVEEADRPREDHPRKFRLTTAGAEWLDQHKETVARPASRVETQQMAHRAVEEAASAKESVQRYRKKVLRLKNRLEELEELKEKVPEISTDVSYQGRSIKRLQERKADETTVKDLRKKFIEFREPMIDRHHDAVDRLEQRLDAQEAAIKDLRKENEQLRSELAELKEWREQNPVRRWFDDD